MRIQEVNVTYNQSRKRYKLNFRNVEPRPPGKQEIYFQNKLQAENYLQKLVDQMPVFCKEKNNYTMQDLYNDFEREELSDPSQHERFKKQRRIKRMLDLKIGSKKFANFLVIDVETAMLQTYIFNSLSVGRAVRTVNHYSNGLGQMFDYAVLNSIIKFNPIRIPVGQGFVSSVKIKGEIKQKPKADASLIYPTVIAKIVDAMPNTYWQAATAFAAFTGARQGEQRAVTWGDIDWDNKIVRISSTVFNKTKFNETKGIWERPFAIKHTTKAEELRDDASERYIPLVDDLLKLLKKHWIETPYKNKKNLIFPSSTGKITSAARFGEKLRLACDKARVKTINWHYLRHHYASILISQSGFEDEDIMELMGHSDIKTTRKVYGHWMKTSAYVERRTARLNQTLSIQNPIVMEQQRYNFSQK
tara:strand:- start:1431 stop:2681 length:1251 start_codon:yes stop_codon:yes gene_type:complete